MWQTEELRNANNTHMFVFIAAILTSNYSGNSHWFYQTNVVHKKEFTEVEIPHRLAECPRKCSEKTLITDEEKTVGFNFVL